MIINQHSEELDVSDGAGNGYHGRCLYCGLALVTDLGYCSWDGSKCIDREVTKYNNIPKILLDYAKFKGLVFINQTFRFVKPYSNEEYTIDQLNELIPK